MKNQNKLLILLALILITSFSTVNVLARENGKKESESKVEIKIKNEFKKEDENEIEEINQSQEVKINNDQFEIRGVITAVSGNNFVVAGQTIFLDPTQVREFKQKGILKEGQDVKVEGIIKNGVKFAEKINVLGTGQGRFKFEIKNAPSLPSSSLTFSSASPSANVKVNLKVNGTVDQIKSFLQQILSFLQNLGS